MRTLLLNPPRWSEVMGKNPAIIERHRGFNPPLGLLYLASALKRYPEHHVEVLDAQPPKYSYAQLESYLREKSYDIIGITALTFTLVDVRKTAKLIKKILPDSKIIIGGWHTHIFPEETLGWEEVDFVLMGEAEFSFPELLKNLNDESSYRKIPGLAYKSSQGRVIKNSFSAIEDLDILPFPDRELLGVKNYGSILSRGRVTTTMISSRGCPYNCTFCDRPFSPIGSRLRMRDPKNVVDEIGSCLEAGIRQFIFYDDTFTVNKARVLAICEEILNRRISIEWGIRSRVDTVDAGMLQMLKKAGCRVIHYGVESGNDRVLEGIKKGFTVRQARDVFALTRKAGIETLAYFMIGLPGENLSEIQDTRDLANELSPDYVHFTVFSPYPATGLYARGLEEGIIKNDVWREFARNPDECFKVPVWEQNFSRRQLYDILISLYKDFYLRPSYFINRLRKINSGNDFLKKTKAGLSILLMRQENVDKVA